MLCEQSGQQAWMNQAANESKKKKHNRVARFVPGTVIAGSYAIYDDMLRGQSFATAPPIQPQSSIAMGQMNAYQPSFPQNTITSCTYSSIEDLIHYHVPKEFDLVPRGSQNFGYSHGATII